MIIEERLISINESTRSGEKIDKVKKIILCGIISDDTISARNNIENMRKIKDVYLSYHYLIGNDGKIIRCIPEDEISYCTYSIDTDLTSISIAIVDDGKKIKRSTIENVCILINNICNRYNLDILSDVIMEYDVTLKRTPRQIVDNQLVFRAIIDYKK